ncbi:MAG: cyclodeaminase/cyclohydrolase family protein [Phycisphaerales bacterium]|nr:cyclodeaminase/cyclohydrolase family protein [Phycisphaerales bacterium]
MSSDQTITGFLDALADKQPTPGGGAAAAMTGATAAATASMVVSYSLGKKKLAEHEESNQAAGKQLANARVMFLKLAEEDAEGYGVLNALWSLDKDDPKRVARWDAAVAGAIAPPRAMLALAVDLLMRIESLVPTTNRMLRSDLGVAAVLAEAAARAAAWNVRINLPLVDETAGGRIGEEIDAELAHASSLCAAIEKGCA